MCLHKVQRMQGLRMHCVHNRVALVCQSNIVKCIASACWAAVVLCVVPLVLSMPLVVTKL